MTNPRLACSALACVMAGVCGGSSAFANDRIGIDLRPSSSNVAVGDVVSVTIHAVKEPSGGSGFFGLGDAFTVLDLFFNWNPQDLRLLGASAAFAPGTAPELISSGFISPAIDYTGINEALPPADGSAYYSGLALGNNPVLSSLEGTLVATLRFQVLREFVSTEVIPIEAVSIPGTVWMEETKVLDAAIAGYNSLGSLGSAIITQGSGGACPADINGDSTVDSSDLSAVLAAWGTTLASANLVVDQGSPTVDGADLAYLLAAWGSCGG